MKMTAIQTRLQRARRNAHQFPVLAELLKRQREELDAVIELLQAQKSDLDKLRAPCER